METKWKQTQKNTKNICQKTLLVITILLEELAAQTRYINFL